MFGFYRVASCSPMVKVADTAFNAKHILALAEKAAANSATIALFPELAVSAYSCGDLFHNETLLNAAEDAVAEIARKTAGHPVILVVGAPVRFNGRRPICRITANFMKNAIFPPEGESRRRPSISPDSRRSPSEPICCSAREKSLRSALKSARTCGARSPRARTLRSTVRF